MHCDVVGKQVVIMLDLAEASCENQAEWLLAGRTCPFVRKEGRFPLGRSSDANYVRRELRRIRNGHGRVGALTYRASASPPQGSDPRRDEVGKRIEAELKKTEKPKNREHD